jgi:hypothetical protein
MDIEIIKDFLYMLDPNKIYIAEGDVGELYQNNIIVLCLKQKHQKQYVINVKNQPWEDTARIWI